MPQLCNYRLLIIHLHTIFSTIRCVSSNVYSHDDVYQSLFHLSRHNGKDEGATIESPIDFCLCFSFSCITSCQTTHNFLNSRHET